MQDIRGEQSGTTMGEPQPLDVEIDPESAALYAEFAKDRTLDEIYRLWIDPEVTNPTIRQRAVTVLTAPNGYQLPYPHSYQSIGRLLFIDEEIDGVQTSSLRERMRNRPVLAKELAQGILYWLDTTGGRIEGGNIDPRRDYYLAIRQLLPVVDEETADMLFARYPLNVTEPYGRMDSAPGYRPLLDLLYDRAIPRKYKDIGLVKWFEAADKEEKETLQPRDECQRAVDSMASFVQGCVYSEGVDDGVLNSIVSYIESRTPAGTAYVHGYMVRQIAELLTDEDIRFNFAWRHLFASQASDLEPFNISDDRDLAFIEWMRGEAHKRMLPLFDEKADALVQAYETSHKKRLAEKAARQATEQALLSRLRSS